MFKLAGNGAAYSNLIVNGGALEPLLQLAAEHVVVESGVIFLQKNFVLAIFVHGFVQSIQWSS
jgi:hypothetical protein